MEKSKYQPVYSRKHPRFSVNFNLLVTQNQFEAVKAKALNVSQGGIFITHLEGIFELNQKVFLEIPAAHPFGCQLMVAKVVHTSAQREEDKKTFTTGLEFEKLTESNREFLRFTSMKSHRI